MEVKSDAYLREVRPVLRRLVDELGAEYQYCSVLAANTSSKRYSVSGRGQNASEDSLFTKRGFVLRVVDKKGVCEYSFNSISEEEIPAIVKRVKEELSPLWNAVPKGIGAMERAIPADEPIRFCKSTEYRTHPAELGDGKILEHLNRIRETAKQADSRIMDCIANVGYQEIHKLFLSKNRDMEQNLLWTNGAIVMLAGRGEEIKDSYRSFSVLGGAEVMDNMEAAIPEMVKTTVELLDSEPMVPGEYECVCAPEVTGMIVHEAFGHGVEMDMFVKDRALAKNFIGQYVASPLVTMHDTACGAAESGSYFFDDEGVPAHDTVVIEKGILKQGISDLLSAGTLGTEPTGNGRRESFERKAYTRMTNTYFEGGTDRVEDMIASVKYGFLLQEPSSGMEDPKNWGIQCMVSIAREIKDGKLTGKIFSPIVLTGYVPDLLRSITMMSPRVELGGGGMCGKGYKEWVKVSDGGPYIKAKIRLG